MSTNNELLIRLAREVAKAMSPSDADIVTKLCTQLDCALAAARTACGERTAAHSTIEKAREVTNCPEGVELQDHLKRLVTENSRCRLEVQRCHQTVDEMFKNRDKWIDKEWLSSIWSTSKRLMEETPATDSILREAEARGVDSLADHLSGMNISVSETSIREFAKQLREGKA